MCDDWPLHATQIKREFVFILKMLETCTYYTYIKIKIRVNFEGVSVGFLRILTESGRQVSLTSKVKSLRGFWISSGKKKWKEMDSIEEIAGNWPIVPAVLMKRQ